MSHNQLLFRSAARERILRGATALAAAVRVTPGPKAKCILIDEHWGRPLVCDDGVTITKAIEPQDPEENLSATFLREAADWTDPLGKHDLIVFIGEAQPPLGKHAFCSQLIEMARRFGAERVFTFAAMATEMTPLQSSRVFCATTDIEKQSVELLFEQAGKDRTKAFELKQELDRTGLFKDDEDRFPELFKRPE